MLPQRDQRVAGGSLRICGAQVKSTRLANSPPAVPDDSSEDSSPEQRHSPRQRLVLFSSLTLLVYAVSSLPYVFGYLIPSGQIRFTGIVFDVVDTAQYFAWMRSC